MKKFLKIVASLVVVAALATAVYFIARPKAKQVAGYETVAVMRGDITNTVTATGTVEPIIQVEVGTQVSGIIDHIYVDYNSIVKKGQLLAELDKEVLQSTLASARADLESNKTEYEYQERNYNRIKGLHEQRMVSDADYETAQYTYDRARSAYQKSQYEVARAETNLGYATIVSPIDGVVLSRDVDEGQTVAASFNTPTLFTIANDLSKMRVIADVDEADIGEVADGQPVTFTVDAYPDDVFHGTVTQVRLQSTTESNVVTYEVVVDAPNPDLKLKPGLTATIAITTQESLATLLVPAKAFRFTPDNAPAPEAQHGHKTLWVQDAQGVRAVSVTPGLTDGIHTEIRNGITEGARVIVSKRIGKAPVGGDMPAGGSSPFMPQPPGQKKK
ncbi:MAG: efflux RND transporter periplasmic adaptor subunit [Rikenellaceae bacterium]|nr:efflux RND transporter periplasmic adaptor subunit [Rikenellaceae bacterium]